MTLENLIHAQAMGEKKVLFHLIRLRFQMNLENPIHAQATKVLFHIIHLRCPMISFEVSNEFGEPNSCSGEKGIILLSFPIIYIFPYYFSYYSFKDFNEFGGVK